MIWNSQTAKAISNYFATILYSFNVKPVDNIMGMQNICWKNGSTFIIAWKAAFCCTCSLSFRFWFSSFFSNTLQYIWFCTFTSVLHDGRIDIKPQTLHAHLYKFYDPGNVTEISYVTEPYTAVVLILMVVELCWIMEPSSLKLRRQQLQLLTWLQRFSRQQTWMKTVLVIQHGIELLDSEGATGKN